MDLSGPFMDLSGPFMDLSGPLNYWSDWFSGANQQPALQQLKPAETKDFSVEIFQDGSQSVEEGMVIYMGVSKNMGKPPNHPFVHRVFHYKPSILVYPYFGNTHIFINFFT